MEKILGVNVYEIKLIESWKKYEEKTKLYAFKYWIIVLDKLDKEN